MSRSLKEAVEYVKAAVQTTVKQNNKGTNFFDLANKLPKNGVDICFKRKNWKFDCYYKVSKVELSPDGRHGQAWGVLYWNGKQKSEQPEKITGTLKKDLWKYVPQNKLAQYAKTREIIEYNHWILEKTKQQDIEFEIKQ
ncbi:hypothetical protein ABK040_003920 [Willaertia magna]